MAHEEEDRIISGSGSGSLFLIAATATRFGESESELFRLFTLVSYLCVIFDCAYNHSLEVLEGRGELSHTRTRIRDRRRENQQETSKHFTYLIQSMASTTIEAANKLIDRNAN